MDEFPKLVFCMPDNVSQIFPLKTHTESILFPESQLALDVLDHFGCSRGRQGKNRDVRQDFTDFRNPGVRRPEVIAPLGDAVRLVHRKETHGHVAHLCEEDIRG